MIRFWVLMGCGLLFAQERPLLSVEAVGNYRYSYDSYRDLAFAAAPIFLETPDPGEQWEFSRVTLMLNTPLGESFFLHGKLDLIDRYDRNPTSSDRNYDLDALWLRWGRESEEDQLPEQGGATYLKIGKFGKFERQDDRHLPSYGLVSTAFNRMEDAGIELGTDLGAHFYLRASFTVGNPLFFRDTNSLAGDNGVGTLGPAGFTPTNSFHNGFPILYDADLETYDFDEPQSGLGLGWKVGNDRYLLNMLAWTRSRNLRDTVAMGGTIYGGDLDLLYAFADEPPGTVPVDPPLIGMSGRKKQETGGNLWLYWSDFMGFAQYVNQEVAGLEIEAWEVEMAYLIEVPDFGGSRFSFALEPAVRHSDLNPHFTGKGRQYPAPSIWWDWRKTDVGLNFHVAPWMKFSLEFSNNHFLVGGKWHQENEWLFSCAYKWKHEF